MEAEARRLGRRIARLRAAIGVSQRGLAPHIGISYAQLSKIEAGLAEPRIGELRRLAKIFGLPLEDLIGPDSGPVLRRIAELNASALEEDEEDTAAALPADHSWQFAEPRVLARAG